MAGWGRDPVRARAAVAILLGLVLMAAGVAYFVSSTATGTLAVQIRDTPVAWSQVVVTLSEVSVRRAGAVGGASWLALPLRVDRIDLLTLGNLTQLLALDRVTPGSYAEVQILLSSVSGVLSSGAPIAMSVSNSIIQSAVDFTVRGGGTTTVTLDLDLGQSISQTAAGWVFTPVLGPTEVG